MSIKNNTFVIFKRKREIKPKALCKNMMYCPIVSLFDKILDLKLK